MLGLSECLLTLFHDGIQNLAAANVRIGLAQLECILGRNTGYREDCALSRLHDRLVGSLNAFVECKGKIRTGCLGAGLEVLGHAAEQERQDDARVAARAAQQSGCRGAARLGEIRRLQLSHFSLGRRHGQRHIGSCITVRYREDVQLVCFVLFFFYRQRTLDDHRGEQLAVNQF